MRPCGTAAPNESDHWADCGRAGQQCDQCRSAGSDHATIAATAAHGGTVARKTTIAAQATMRDCGSDCATRPRVVPHWSSCDQPHRGRYSGRVATGTPAEQRPTKPYSSLGHESYLPWSERHPVDNYKGSRVRATAPRPCSPVSCGGTVRACHRDARASMTPPRISEPS